MCDNVSFRGSCRLCGSVYVVLASSISFYTVILWVIISLNLGFKILVRHI